MFDLVNIFSVFLPQLLLYPNPSDPLNGEAARLYMQDKDRYTSTVREYVQRFASSEVTLEPDDDESMNDDDDAPLSDMDDDHLVLDFSLPVMT